MTDCEKETDAVGEPFCEIDRSGCPLHHLAPLVNRLVKIYAIASSKVYALDEEDGNVPMISLEEVRSNSREIADGAVRLPFLKLVTSEELKTLRKERDELQREILPGRSLLVAAARPTRGSTEGAFQRPPETFRTTTFTAPFRFMNRV